MWLVVLWGCGGMDCGDAMFATAGDALAMWDSDGDGANADLIERCGASWGTYGLRRHDIGLTSLILSPNVPSGKFEEDLEVASLLLPGAEIAFLTEHLAAGATITPEQIGGYGLHKLHGTIEPGYVTYGLLDATITVLDGPKPVPGSFEEDEAERWELQWDVVLGDVQLGTALQEWHATDVVDISNGIEIGDPAAFPPDWAATP